MNNNPTDSPASSSSRQETFSTTSQIVSHKHHRKKRSKLVKIGDIAPTQSPSHTHGYSPKPKPWKKPQFDAPKITRPCSECGKRFWSWKALFGHMRCHPERQWRGINPPPNFQRPVASPFQTCFSEEDHEVATCLLMLANGSSSIDIPCLMINQNADHEEYSVGEPSGVGFECSSCKKVFGSHQALGGHRASHKNVKGCFAIARNNEDEVVEQCCGDDQQHQQSEDDEVKMVMLLGHKCSICQRVFSSGQALGGHKRCHWEKGEEQPNPGLNLDPSSSREGALDLNLPAPMDTDEGSNNIGLALDLRLGI